MSEVPLYRGGLVCRPMGSLPERERRRSSRPVTDMRRAGTREWVGQSTAAAHDQIRTRPDPDTTGYEPLDHRTCPARMPEQPV